MNEGNVLLTGSIKDAVEASGHEFKVRSVSMTVLFLQPRPASWMQVRSRPRLNPNQQA